MKQSAALVANLQSIANQLKSAAVWNGSLAPVDADSDDFVYELLCFFEAVLAAHAAYSLIVAGKLGKGRKGEPIALWPRKSGFKHNFSFVLLCPTLPSGSSYQLCPGIRISDRHNKYRAPDINLLTHDAPDKPSHCNLRGCWDAKYTKHSTKRLPDNAVSDFSYTYDHLGFPTPPSDWAAGISNSAFTKSGLLTNGQHSTERDAALAETGISETSGFPDNPATRP